MYVFIFLVKVTDWPPIGKIAAHSAYEMFSWYRYLIFSLVFSHLRFFGVGIFCRLRLFLIFAYLCLFLLVSLHTNPGEDLSSEMKFVSAFSLLL